MACEVAMMNPQVDVPAMGGLYNQATWNQPLSPVHAHSPIGSMHSPSSVSVHSPVLSHAGSPMPAMPGCCSPVTVHSPNMQAAHSPVMHGSPADSILNNVKQEQMDAELRYNVENCCDSLSSLLRNDMIAAQNMAMIPPHMQGPPHPREILDGEFTLIIALFTIISSFLLHARWHSYELNYKDSPFTSRYSIC